jgi:hypothetical protein
MDSSSSLTPPEEHGRRRDRDDRDLRDVVHGRDAHRQIDNRRQEIERLEQEHHEESDRAGLPDLSVSGDNFDLVEDDPHDPTRTS